MSGNSFPTRAWTASTEGKKNKWSQSLNPPLWWSRASGHLYMTWKTGAVPARTHHYLPSKHRRIGVNLAKPSLSGRQRPHFRVVSHKILEPLNCIILGSLGWEWLKNYLKYVSWLMWESQGNRSEDIITWMSSGLSFLSAFLCSWVPPSQATFSTRLDSWWPAARPQLSQAESKNGDFLGGPVVKNLPSNAGDVGSIPGGGTKIPHAMGQLSPCDPTQPSK